jgi:hypothetical protein
MFVTPTFVLGSGVDKRLTVVINVGVDQVLPPSLDLENTI